MSVRMPPLPPGGLLPGVEVVHRVGSRAYGKAACRALPDAVRVGDRRHIWEDLCPGSAPTVPADSLRDKGTELRRHLTAACPANRHIASAKQTTACGVRSRAHGPEGPHSAITRVLGSGENVPAGSHWYCSASIGTDFHTYNLDPDHKSR
ncbi:hypothetical protein AADR41_05670 [Streptomyces sp. CLV115]|uniref:hypothetical protein n=1 Tax=Streptomyces sp. CLV115 TaxID=3138502 RepID=UPI00313B7F2E